MPITDLRVQWVRFAHQRPREEVAIFKLQFLARQITRSIGPILTIPRLSLDPTNAVKGNYESEGSLLV